MANFGAGYGANAFGGFPGGYNQTPGGIVPNEYANPIGAGFVPTIGTNLPSVDPNTYPGTVHFGPSVVTEYNGQFPAGIGGAYNPDTF